MKKFLKFLQKSYPKYKVKIIKSITEEEYVDIQQKYSDSNVILFLTKSSKNSSVFEAKGDGTMMISYRGQFLVFTDKDYDMFVANVTKMLVNSGIDNIIRPIATSSS